MEFVPVNWISPSEDGVGGPVARWPGGLAGGAGRCIKGHPAHTVTHTCDGGWPALSVAEDLNKTRSPWRDKGSRRNKNPEGTIKTPKRELRG